MSATRHSLSALALATLIACLGAAPTVHAAKPATATATAAIKGLVAGPADGRDLKPGEFQWDPQASPSGDIVVVVSLPEQRAHVYRGGVRIGVSTVSTGKSGKETPTGTFPILQKAVKWNSNRYNNAPMPYMQRLTWDGIALHAGALPGYPASHGCVRLPLAFARLLFGETSSKTTTVVVADEVSHDLAVAYPGDVMTEELRVAARTIGEVAGAADMAPLQASRTHPPAVVASNDSAL